MGAPKLTSRTRARSRTERTDRPTSNTRVAIAVQIRSRSAPESVRQKAEGVRTVAGVLSWPVSSTNESWSVDRDTDDRIVHRQRLRRCPSHRCPWTPCPRRSTPRRRSCRGRRVRPRGRSRIRPHWPPCRPRRELRSQQVWSVIVLRHHPIRNRSASGDPIQHRDGPQREPLDYHVVHEDERSEDDHRISGQPRPEQ